MRLNPYRVWVAAVCAMLALTFWASFKHDRRPSLRNVVLRAAAVKSSTTQPT